MRLTTSLVVTLAIALPLPAVPAPVAAGEPGAQLQRQIDRVLAVLEDGQRDAAERRREIRAIVDETFDFPEAAHRALGRHWDAQTPEDRARFVRLFVGPDRPRLPAPDRPVGRRPHGGRGRHGRGRARHRPLDRDQPRRRPDAGELSHAPGRRRLARDRGQRGRRRRLRQLPGAVRAAAAAPGGSRTCWSAWRRRSSLSP
jgi:hypothetical protein